MTLEWTKSPDSVREGRDHYFYTADLPAPYGHVVVEEVGAGPNDWGWLIMGPDPDDNLPHHMRFGFADAEAAMRHVERFLEG